MTKDGISWMYSGADDGYWIKVYNEKIHFTKSKVSRDLFIAQLKIKQKMKEIEPYQQLVDAIKKMGWTIAVPTENADDEILRGLIISEDSYVDDILEQIEGDE